MAKKDTTAKVSAGDAMLANNDAQPAAAATTTKAPKAAKDPDATPKAPKPKIPAGSTPSQVLAFHISDPEQLAATSVLLKGQAADANAVTTTAAIIDKLAKKVAEKAINILRHAGTPDSVQVYTRIALDKLIADGSLTSKGLQEEYAKKYRPGTCSAQGNQIMQLFPALSMATRNEDRSISLNKASVLVTRYQQGGAK